MAGLLGRGTSAITRARPILAGVLGLSLAACGGGGGGGGTTPVTGGSPAPPPSSGIGPTLPTGFGDGSAYPAFISASTVDASLAQSSIQQPSVTSPGILFNPGSTQINAIAASQTVRLNASDVVYDRGYQGLIVQEFRGENNTFVGTLVRLDHVAFSTWARLAGGGGVQVGAAAGGIQTPGAEVPVSGSATYRGVATGVVVTPSTHAMFTGPATLTANFGARTISGNLSSMSSIDLFTAVERPFNSISLNGSWAPGSSAYTGTVTTGASPGGPSAMPAGATGPMAGAFFGSGAGAARETGGSFSITSPGNGVVHGSFGARR